MALKQNTTLLAQLPLRQIGGGVAGLRAMWNRSERRNHTVGEGIPFQLAGIPSGLTAPAAWVLPYRAGRISSRTLGISITAQASGTRGLVATGTASFTFTAAAVGGLIVSTTGTATFSIFTNNPVLRATVGTTGLATFSLFTNTPTLGAIANLTGNATMSFSASAPSYAIGHMTGLATSAEALSPQSLAAAVWNTIATEYNTSGTMGNKLNSAASGGVDYNSLAQSVWEYVDRSLTTGSGLTLQQFLALKD
jgi:hypothetical protein